MRVLPIVLLAALTAPAAADKFSHTADKPKVPELSERTKPPTSQPTAPARPTITGDKMLEIETTLVPINDEQEQILIDLIAQTEDTDPDKPDYMFRLAELYAKQQRTFSLQATQKQLDADHAKDGKSKARLADEATALAKKAENKLLRAARAYKAMTEKQAFKNYPKMDVALFYFAFTLEKANHIKDARDVFDRLLKEYPSSKYVPEAHLAFADFYFEQGQLADAKDRYDKVLKFPQSSVYWYAMYMTGWVQLNQKLPQDALSSFFKVVQGTTDGKHDAIHRAATKDFVRAYAEIGKAEQALSSFKRINNKDAYDMLDILADLYVHDGKADRAIYVLRELMHDQPKSNRVCTWEENVAREMMVGGSKADQIHEIEQLVKLYSAVGNTLPAADASECHDAAAEMSGQLARAYHQEAVKTQNVELFGLSDKLYRAYLTGFKDAPDWAETGFYHAELLWARADMERKNPRLQAQMWEDAAGAYTDLVQTGKLDAQLTKTSADAAMQAWMHAFAVDPRNHAHDGPVAEGEAKYDKVPEPRKLSDNDQKLMAAYDVYLKLVKDPNDEELVDVEFQKGRLYHKYDHLEEAIAIFEDILAKHHDHEAALFAANLELDSYNLLHQYDDMLALATRLQADGKFMDKNPELKPVLADLQRTYLKKKADDQRDKGLKSKDLAQLVECGASYLAIYNAAPLAADAEQALFNSGVCYEEGKSLSAAILAFTQVQKLFPTSPNAAKAGAHLGKIYADVAYYREAAGKLEEYASKYAGETEAYQALSDAVSYRKGIGDDDQAIKDTELFVSKFGAKHPKEAANASWALTAIYEKQGDLDKLARSLRSYIDKYGTTGGDDRLVTAYSRLGDALWKASCSVPTVDGSCAKVSRELTGVRLKVNKKKKEVKTTCGDDDKIKVTVVDRDAARVKAAMSAYGSAIAAYDKRAGKTGGDERGAKYFYAMAKIGVAERDFEAYMAMPLPTGLDFDERKPAIAKKAHERFDTWAKVKLDLGGKIRVQYQAVIDLSDGATAIASAARIGQLQQSFSGQLFRAEIPANLRDASTEDLDLGQIYCDALTEKADVIEQAAINAYKFCIDTSTKLGWFSEWSRVCERELGQLDPKNWPTAAEKRRTPDEVSAIVDVEGPAKL